MLLSSDRKIAISNLGWVDKNSLWCFDEDSGQVRNVPLGDARYLSLYPSEEQSMFAVLHHYENNYFYYSIHRYDNPSQELCSAELSANGAIFKGNKELFAKVPRYLVTYYDPGNNPGFYLFLINHKESKILLDTFDWYDDSYDKGYQGITSTIELSNGSILVSIQRDSNPVLYDPIERRVLKKISLAGNHGNPKLCALKHRNEIWADDYDTIIKLDPHSFDIIDMKNLQQAENGTNQFIGSWTFNHDETECIIARPFSGDVISISTQTLKTKATANLGKQPLEAVILSSGEVLSRDWKSGELLKGKFKRNGLPD